MKKKMMTLVMLMAMSLPVVNAGAQSNGDPCVNDPGTTTYAPDYMYCSKFFVCIMGTWYNMDCPAGLEYNPATITCDLYFNIPRSAAGCFDHGTHTVDDHPEIVL